MEINLEKEENTSSQGGTTSTIDLAEAREFAIDAIEKQKHSANWTIKKLVEKGLSEDNAQAVVADIMAPILLQKAKIEASNHCFLVGAGFLVIGTALLILEILFLDKIHFLLIAAPFIGLYQIGKGIYIRNSKD
ncbi:MAG: hypothetical protein MJZ33_09785 [Paludibacteraceae bacterium]|nr:hypothetical protein [Paludibacteraceae bacterium]